jgi:hypothetical protein
MNRHYARKLLARFFSDFMKSRSPIVMASYRNRRELLDAFATYCVDVAITGKPIARKDEMQNEHRDPANADRIDLDAEDRRHLKYLADNPDCPAAVETRRRASVPQVTEVHADGSKTVRGIILYPVAQSLPASVGHAEVTIEKTRLIAEMLDLLAGCTYPQVLHCRNRLFAGFQAPSAEDAERFANTSHR